MENDQEKPTVSSPTCTALLCCPFCGGKAVWCDTHDENDIHTCHFIKCVGECGSQFDTVADDNSAETIEELKVIALNKFNARAS